MPEIPGLPRIPTDNLYKFAALLGVFVMLFSYGFGIYIDIESSSLIQSEAADARERNYLEFRADTLRMRARNLLRAGLVDRADVLQDSAAALDDSLHRTQRSADMQVTWIDVRRSILIHYVRATWVVCAIGFYIAFWGFVGWYFRLQHPLDQIVMREAAGITAARRVEAVDESRDE